MTTHNIPLAGVIGNPIAHSRSPRLHRHWLRKHGLLGEYIPLHVQEDNLETVVRTLPKMGFVGANVTVPHKVAVLGLADQVSDRATLIGAANTLIFKGDGKLYADNTDGYSMRDLTARQVSIKQQYLMLAKIDVQFEQSHLQSWQHAPLEKKLARAKIATAKINVEVAEAKLNEALDSHREARKVIVIPHAEA
jgi:hypothetical protein